MVELTDGAWIYGGVLRTPQEARPFVADIGRIYADLMTRIVSFFQGSAAPVPLEATREIMAVLDAAERSFKSGRPEPTGL